MTKAGLQILNGTGSGQRLDLTSGTTLFGRLPSCDLVFSETTVSRRHARIVRKTDGYYLEDLDSRNGTYLNGQRVHQAVRLTDQDRIYLHEIALLFSEEPAGAATLPPDKARPPKPGSSARENRTDRRFSETVAEIDMAAFADQQRHVNAAVKLDAMLQMTRNLQTSLELDEVLTRVLEGLSRILPQFQRMYILRIDHPGGEFVTAAYKQRGDSGALTVPPIAQSVAREVMASGKAILSVDVLEDRPAEADRSVLETEHGSFMCTPLVGGARKPLGVIYVETEEADRQFVPDDLDVLACVALLAGHAVEQATLHSARYRAVVDTAVDGIMTVNEQGTVESANPAVEQLFGYQPEELVGAEIGILLPSADENGRDQPLMQRFHAAGSKKSDSGLEIRVQRKDGSDIPVRVSIGQFDLDGRTYFTAILHDVTEQKRAETALKQLNEKLEERVQRRTESLRLLQDVTVIANEAETILPAFQAALERICRYIGWPAGRVFMRWSRHVETFFDTAIWSIERQRDIAKEGDVEGANCFLPEGALKRVIATGQPEWIADLSSVEPLLRTPPVQSLGSSAALSRSHGGAAGPETVPPCGTTRMSAPSEESTHHRKHPDSSSRRCRPSWSELKAALLFPVLMADEVVAVFVFFSKVPHKPDESLLDALSHVGTQLGRVVERHWLQRELIDAVWQQQCRFGQELHDTLGQQLSGLSMMANSIAQKLHGKELAEAGAVRELSEMIQQAKSDARRLAKGLFPVDVDAQGLRSALEELARSTECHTRIQCVVDCEPGMRVPDNAVATHLFRIAQEAVNNAVKHSGAERIVVSVAGDPSRIVLQIRDYGTGILKRTVESSAGFGIRIMRYRANAIGATLTVAPGEEGGTIVNCTVCRRDGSNGRK